MKREAYARILPPPGAFSCIRSDLVSGCITARAMVRWRASSFIRGASYRGGEHAGGEELVGLERFVVDFLEGGDAVVPLEQRGGVADALDGAIIEFPHRIDDRMIVRIEDVFAIFRMAGDVNLRDAFGGNAADVVDRIETVILR